MNRVRKENPSLDVGARECAARGVTAQHSRPLPADRIAGQAPGFERCRGGEIRGG